MSVLIAKKCIIIIKGDVAPHPMLAITAKNLFIFKWFVLKNENKKMGSKFIFVFMYFRVCNIIMELR